MHLYREKRKFSLGNLKIVYPAIELKEDCIYEVDIEPKKYLLIIA